MKRSLAQVVVASLVIAMLAIVAPAAARSVEQSAVEDARNAVLDGVTTLSDPTQPGRMIVYGEDSFSIGNYPGKDHSEPMIAGAFWGNGRVIATGDHQFLNMDNYGDDANTQSGQFYRNGLAWLAATESKDISIVVLRTQAAEWLTAQGYTSVVQPKNNVTAADLVDVDVVVGWMGSTVPDETITALSDFVQAGGGLFLAEYGVGYQWWWTNVGVRNAPGNRLLRDVGISFAPSYTSGLTPSRATGHTTADQAIQMLSSPEDFTAAEHLTGGVILKALGTVLPLGDPLAARIENAYELLEVTSYPTPSTPVTDQFQQALLLHQAEKLSNTPANEVVKHPVADELYGAVESADRVNATVTIDLALPRWQATGLFVAAGEVVTVRVPPELVGNGYRLRVNAHTDNISRRPTWERPPVVHRWFPIDSTEVQVANGFGGLLFVDLGGRPPGAGTALIEVENAVEAPYFVLGTHTDAEWNTSLRNRPAPFAVLVSESLMLSVPVRHIDSANLTEPERLMTWWNAVTAGQDDLTGQIRTSPELANIDRQISAGAAHSGYPYQAYEKHWGNMVDVDRLTTVGSWGDFHELGHNHQRGWWTFAGDSEVSVNIMSNYSLETQISGRVGGGWGYSTNENATWERAKKDIAAGGTYSDKPHRWSFWFQLADGFGWDAYRNVFRQYEDDNRTDRSLLPSSDAEKKSQWFQRFSTEVGFDMSPFMVDMWGLQVSAEARAAVAHLPKWGPVIATDLELTTDGGNPVTFTPGAGVDAMIPSSITVDEPTGGTVMKNADGTWTYDPMPGRVTQEQFNYHIASASGVYASRKITVANNNLPVPTTPTPLPEPTAVPTAVPTPAAPAPTFSDRGYPCTGDGYTMWSHDSVQWTDLSMYNDSPPDCAEVERQSGGTYPCTGDGYTMWSHDSVQWTDLSKYNDSPPDCGITTGSANLLPQQAAPQPAPAERRTVVSGGHVSPAAPSVIPPTPEPLAGPATPTPEPVAGPATLAPVPTELSEPASNNRGERRFASLLQAGPKSAHNH